MKNRTNNKKAEKQAEALGNKKEEYKKLMDAVFASWRNGAKYYIHLDEMYIYMSYN